MPDPGDDQVRPEDTHEQLSAEEEAKAARQADRFDIRRIIGGVFLVYGTLLTVMGIVGSHHMKTKAAGININLWTGIGMLIFAALMITWALTRPVSSERLQTGGEASDQLGRAPAT